MMLFVIPLKSYSQYQMVSLYLGELYKQINKYPFDNNTPTLRKGNIIIANIIIENQSFPIIIEKNQDTIQHIGLAVFSRRDSLPQTAITRFLERKTLEYLLTDSDKLPRLMNSDGVGFLLNSHTLGSMVFPHFSQALALLLNFKSYSVIFQEKKFVLSFESAKNDTLIITFPARVDLITGMDKKEMEHKLAGRLQTLNTNYLYSKIDKTQKKKLKGTLYVREGTTYFDIFNSNIYLTQKDESFSYVFEPHYPKESIENLFQLVLPACDSIKMDISYHIYDRIQKLNNVPLDAFNFEMMKRHNIGVYAEYSAKDTIDITVLYISREYDYTHLLYATIPVKKIFGKGSKSLNVDFYSYIRQDNVKNLFPAEKTGKRKKILLKGLINVQ